MNFFLYQPELFYSINIIPGQMIGKISAVILFGLGFVLLFLLGSLLVKRFNLPLKNAFIITALIAWLPLFFQFSYSSIIDFKNIFYFIGAPEEAQILWRFCSLDKNQKYDGGICKLYPFVKEVERIIPSGSAIKVFSTNIEIYFNYYFYGPYRIVPTEQAEYFVFYRTPNIFLYDAGKLYSVKSRIKDYLADVVLIKSYDQDTAIFKKVK